MREQLVFQSISLRNNLKIAGIIAIVLTFFVLANPLVAVALLWMGWWLMIPGILVFSAGTSSTTLELNVAVSMGSRRGEYFLGLIPVALCYGLLSTVVAVLLRLVAPMVLEQSGILNGISPLSVGAVTVALYFIGGGYGAIHTNHRFVATMLLMLMWVGCYAINGILTVIVMDDPQLFAELITYISMGIGLLAALSLVAVWRYIHKFAL